MIIGYFFYLLLILPKNQSSSRVRPNLIEEKQNKMRKTKMVLYFFITLIMNYWLGWLWFSYNQESSNMRREC